MANYKEIQGYNIQSKSTDPYPFAQAKTDQPWGGTWAAGNNLNTARGNGIGGAHTDVYIRYIFYIIV